MARSRVVSAERAVRFDEGRHPRAKIGYVLLATEQTIEEDVMRLKPPGVGVQISQPGKGLSFTWSQLGRPLIGRRDEGIPDARALDDGDQHQQRRQDRPRMGPQAGP